MADDIWGQELYYICPICRIKLPDGDVHITSYRNDLSYAKCPNCGNESVFLMEYW
jgi:hypothetical protein